MNDPFFYIFCNIQSSLNSVARGTPCTGFAADIILGCLSAQPLLLVELLVPLLLMFPHSSPTAEDIRLPRVLPLDNVYTIRLASLDALVEFLSTSESGYLFDVVIPVWKGPEPMLLL